MRKRFAQAAASSNVSMMFLVFGCDLKNIQTTFPDYFRIVDLRRGKKIDDGYHAIHLYYQRDNLAYPIEVHCGAVGTIFLISGAINIYKYRAPEVGQKLYQESSDGLIQTEQDFLKHLK